MVYIFYMHNVVGVFINSIDLIYGGAFPESCRYSSAHTSKKTPWRRIVSKVFFSTKFFAKMDE